MKELADCRTCLWRPLHPHERVRFHPWLGIACGISFIVNRPKDEPGFRLERQEVGGRSIRYTTRAYALDRPEGERYADQVTASGWQARRIAP